MASIDISLINSASIIIVFMLLFIGGWGILQVVNPFKDKAKGFYGIFAFLIALILIMTPNAVKVITTMTPWLVLLVMIGFFFIFFAMMFGVKEGSIQNIMLKSGAKGWLITLVVIILLFSLGSAFGPGLLGAQVPQQSPSANYDPSTPVMDASGNIVPAGTINAAGSGSTGTGTSGAPAGTATGDYGTNLIFTLINPKVLGMIFLMLLGTLTVVLLND